MLCEREHEPTRLVRLGAAEGRDRVERVEEEVRLDLRLHRSQLGRRRRARVQVHLAELDLGRDEGAEVTGDGAVAVRDRERLLAEEDDRADGVAAVHDRRDDRRAQGAVAPVAAVLPAHGQSRHAPLEHGVDSAGRCRQPCAVMVGAQPGVGEHVLPVAHRDGRVAQALARLVGHDLRAGGVEAAPQGAADGLDRLQDRRRRRLAEWHDPAERGAHEPQPGHEGERRQRHDGDEPAERRALVLQHAQDDEEQQRLQRRQRRGDHQRAAHLVPSAPDLGGRQAATGRDEDEAFAALVGIAHVRATLPGLAQRGDLGQRARVDDLVARCARAPGHEDAELLVVERCQAVRIGGDDELDAAREREPGMGGPQVEPVRLRVDLEERAVLGAGGDQRLDVEAVALALSDQAPGRDGR